MHRQQDARPRAKSAFAAAFLSLLFPGLGHAYAGAPYRALGFAAVPVLLVAFMGGLVLRLETRDLISLLLNPTVLTSVFVLNIVALLYRLAAIVDAYRVTQHLNAFAATGARPGSTRLPRDPVSLAGLLAIVIVMSGVHVVVARYEMLATSLLSGGCIFIGDDQADDECEVDATPSPGNSGPPTEDPDPIESLEPITPAPSPVGTAVPNVSIPPWDGQERLNILLIGSDQRPGDGGSNTDTLIVVSVDPVTKQVAMFSVPRDTVDVPVPAGPARNLFGRVYAGKINSFFMAVRNREDLFPGTNRTRGYNGLKAIMGELTGLDVKYFVEVNFEGFRKVVDAAGGVTINVQVPVVDDNFPSGVGRSRRIYIPAGLQHMTGAEALRYARSRHGSDDFDRGARQQRVLLSLREQVDPNDLIPRLPALVEALQSAVRTDIPVDQLDELLGLAASVDTRNIRTLVFTPPFYQQEFLSSPRGYIIVPNVARIQKAVRDAFSDDPLLAEERDVLSAEGASVWVLNGTSEARRGARLAGYLEYHGLLASSPRQKPEGAIPADTKIVVYNGAETRSAKTIAFLEETFGVTATTEIDPEVRADITVTIGRATPDLRSPAS
jgi:LCP family protein required for cell wall assembly